MNGQEKNQYRLDVRLKDQSPMKIDVVDTITAGLDPRCDLVLVGNKIKNKQLVFEKKGENLALHYFGNSNQTFLNSLPLEENKTYLLEPGDRIAFSGAEIIIRHELVVLHESQQIKNIIFTPAADLTPESATEKIMIADNPTGSLTKQPKVRPAFFEQLDTASLLSLWMTKIYAMIFDVFITYLILVFLFPLIFIHPYALEVLNYLSSVAFFESPHSFFPFLVAWYIVSFSQTLLFGTTVGQFILGLRVKSENKFGKLILFRLKTFLYSLFLFPAQNSISPKLFFKAMRKAGVILIFIFILSTPFFLPLPYNVSITKLTADQSVKRELHTRSLYSASKVLGLHLNAEVSLRYLLTPFVSENREQRAFQFFDLKNNQSVIIKEKDSFHYFDIEEQLKYANPLYSTIYKKPFAELPIKTKKKIIETILLSSPETIQDSLVHLGPMMGSALLFKKSLMEGLSGNDITANFYSPNTPVILLQNSTQAYFYLFTPHELKRFSVDSKSRNYLVAVFADQIFSKLLSGSEESVVLNKQKMGLFEAQDAFLQGDEQSFLTYYAAVANNLSNVRIIHDEVDLSNKAKLALTSNIEALMKFIKNTNVQNSFNDIIDQLTPMEKPGEQR